MNLAALVAAAAATVNVVTALIAAYVSRAPGWRAARVIVAVAATAGLYNLTSLWLMREGMSDGAYQVGGRVAYLVATLNAVAWVWFAYAPRQGTRPEWPVAVRRVSGASVLVSVLLALTGWHLQPTVSIIDVPWAHVRYHYPLTTVLGDVYGLVPLGLLLLALSRLIVRMRTGEPELGISVAGFAAFFLCAVDEFLVANRFVTFLSLADVGFVGVVVPLTIQLVHRVVEDARRLDALSTQLEHEVRIRTSERDAARDALIESERLAALGRLAGGVGHEINNPLTYMFFALDEIEQGVQGRRTPADTATALAQAREGASRIQKVVEGLRSYSRNQGAPTRIELRAIVEAALRVAGPRLRHVARLDTSHAPCPPVLGDEPKLVQAAVNLLVNAGQAVEDLAGRGVITVRTGTTSRGDAFLSVSDNGAGIAREHLERLWEPYFTTRVERGGLGLGLFVTRGVADAHDGHVDVASEPGVATTFTLRLPGVRADAPAPGPATSALASAAAPLGTLLLVDDDPLVRSSLARSLRRWWRVVAVESGQAALEALDHQRFDAVACDLQMPGLSGIHVADLLARQRPDVLARTVFLTGGAMTREAEAFLARPDITYVEKPVDVSRLNDALGQAALMRRTPPDERRS